MRKIHVAFSVLIYLILILCSSNSSHIFSKESSLSEEDAKNTIIRYEHLYREEMLRTHRPNDNAITYLYPLLRTYKNTDEEKKLCSLLEISEQVLAESPKFNFLQNEHDSLHWELIQKLCTAPWTREEFPKAASWIDSNKPIFPVIERMSNCSQFIIISLDEPKDINMENTDLMHVMFGELLNDERTIQSDFMDLRDTLVAYNMLLIGEKKISDAWSLCYSFLKISRVMQMQFDASIRAIGYSNERICQGIAFELIKATPILPDLYEKILSDLENLDNSCAKTHLSLTPQMFYYGCCLDLATYFRGPKGIKLYLSLMLGDRNLTTQNYRILLEKIDIRNLEKTRDAWSERLSKRNEKSNERQYASFLKEVQKSLDDEFSLLQMTVKKADDVVDSIKEKDIENFFVNNNLKLALIELENYFLTQRINMMLKTTVALLLAYQEKKTLPQKIEDLCPRYLSFVPVDIETETVIRYSKSKDGFTLHSHGTDGKYQLSSDNKYRYFFGAGELRSSFGNDDIGVHMPVVVQPISSDQEASDSEPDSGKSPDANQTDNNCQIGKIIEK